MIFTPVISGEVHPSCTRALNRIFKDPELHIYKTRKGDRDEYSLELIADRTKGTKAEISKVFETPDFTNTWVAVKAGGKDFGLNIYDIYKTYGGLMLNGVALDCGLTADITTIDKDGDAPEIPNIQVRPRAHVHYRDEAGNVTDFKCKDWANYLRILAEWDGSN